LTSSKTKDDESISEMFHRLQVIVNDLWRLWVRRTMMMMSHIGS
jgi:hypothetical protein